MLKKNIRSFGRIKSRKLSNHKNDLFKNKFSQYQIDFTDLSFFSKSNNKNILEIGFGFGDFLFAKAKENLDKNFFGFEPHINGVVNLLAKLENKKLTNLKISNLDVREVMNNFEDNFFDQIYILFPDPWPKAKHFKRRLITQNFLDEILADKLKKGSILTIATDHDSYKIWILAEYFKSKKFLWLAENHNDWNNFPSDWIETKYQKKAALEGRKSIILNFKKI